MAGKRERKSNVFFNFSNNHSDYNCKKKSI